MTRQSTLAPEAQGVHGSKFAMEDGLRAAGAHILTHSRAIGISDAGVRYLDQNGDAHTIPCDTVLVTGGMKPVQELALELAPLAPEFYMAGDCIKVGDLVAANRSAFAAASQIN